MYRAGNTNYWSLAAAVMRNQSVRDFFSFVVVISLATYSPRITREGKVKDAYMADLVTPSGPVRVRTILDMRAGRRPATAVRRWFRRYPIYLTARILSPSACGLPATVVLRGIGTYVPMYVCACLGTRLDMSVLRRVIPSIIAPVVRANSVLPSCRLRPRYAEHALARPVTANHVVGRRRKRRLRQFLAR